MCQLRSFTHEAGSSVALHGRCIIMICVMCNVLQNSEKFAAALSGMGMKVGLPFPLGPVYLVNSR
jgi:hypothetical protein